MHQFELLVNLYNTDNQLLGSPHLAAYTVLSKVDASEFERLLEMDRVAFRRMCSDRRADGRPVTEEQVQVSKVWKQIRIEFPFDIYHPHRIELLIRKPVDY